MTETSRTIMAGDLTGRLPTAGTGDELDRLADNLNVMLERIEALMRGFKEVSDNIAHDLKTPLTRLRNRAEEALRTGQAKPNTAPRSKATIEESDELIRTFNALLMIARAESGQARDNMIDFDAAEIARDVGELYEPLADEKGLALKVEARGRRRSRQSRTGEPGAGQSGRQRDQICRRRMRRRSTARAPEIVVRRPRGRPHPADGRRSAGQAFPRSRSRSRGRAICAAGAEPLQPGSGLGLSLASAVARLHGGELRLEDNRRACGQCSRCRAAVPPAEPSEAQSPPPRV